MDEIVGDGRKEYTQFIVSRWLRCEEALRRGVTKRKSKQDGLKRLNESDFELETKMNELSKSGSSHSSILIIAEWWDHGWKWHVLNVGDETSVAGIIENDDMRGRPDCW